MTTFGPSLARPFVRGNPAREEDLSPRPSASRLEPLPVGIGQDAQLLQRPKLCQIVVFFFFRKSDMSYDSGISCQCFVNLSELSPCACRL